MEENKIMSLISTVRKGQQAILFKEYADDVFKEIRLNVMVQLETAEQDKTYTLIGILKGLKEIENVIISDINNAKMAERKISDCK